MNYAQSAKTAKRLLTSFGQAMTLSSITVGVYDPETSTVINTSIDTVADGVILPYSNGIENSPNSLIQQGDSQVLISLSVTPKPADTLTVGTVVYTIVNVKELAPNGTLILFDIQVRK